MVMDWNDCFKYGMFRGWQVKSVFDVKPSYLVWTVVNTNHKFTDPVLEALCAMARIRGATPIMMQKFREDVVGVPW